MKKLVAIATLIVFALGVISFAAPSTSKSPVAGQKVTVSQKDSVKKEKKATKTCKSEKKATACKGKKK